MTTILYSEAAFPDPAFERELFGPEAEIIRRDVGQLADLDDADCARTDGLMLFRHFFPATQMARFPRLKVVVRMGVGYDRIDRAEAARRGITVCNCPDYGTTEVADHALALALTLRRGVLLHHEAQRRAAAWKPIDDPLVRRLSLLTVGIVGLGRIGTAAALRFKALGCRVLRPARRRRSRCPADRAAGRANPRITARLSRPGAMAGGPAHRHPAQRFRDAGSLRGHQAQIRRNHAGGADRQQAAKRDPAGSRLVIIGFVVGCLL